MHSTSQDCKKSFVWRGYNRFSQVELIQKIQFRSLVWKNRDWCLIGHTNGTFLRICKTNIYVLVHVYVFLLYIYIYVYMYARVNIFVSMYTYMHVQNLQNDCLSFLVRTPGAIDVAISEMPTRPQGAVIMHIGVDESVLQTWDESRQGWVRVSVGVLIWSSMMASVHTYLHVSVSVSVSVLIWWRVQVHICMCLYVCLWEDVRM